MQNPNTQLVLPATLVGDDGIELAANPHPRGVVVALVDTSQSLAPYIDELQEAIDTMLRVILIEDVVNDD